MPLTRSIADTADDLNVCRATVYNLINAGKLKTAKIGRRTVVLSDSIRDLLGIELKAA